MMAFCDGERVALLASSEDHKAVGDGDVGPNTGGMGTYSPSPLVDERWPPASWRPFFVPTVRALARAGRPFRGLLYGGLMLTPDRGPMVIEWNCRFGDPETQSVLAAPRGRSGPVAGGRGEGECCRPVRPVRRRDRRVRGAGRRRLSGQTALGRRDRRPRPEGASTRTASRCSTPAPRVGDGSLRHGRRARPRRVRRRG